MLLYIEQRAENAYEKHHASGNPWPFHTTISCLLLSLRMRFRNTFYYYMDHQVNYYSYLQKQGFGKYEIMVVANLDNEEYQMCC